MVCNRYYCGSEQRESWIWCGMGITDASSFSSDAHSLCRSDMHSSKVSQDYYDDIPPSKWHSLYNKAQLDTVYWPWRGYGKPRSFLRHGIASDEDFLTDLRNRTCACTMVVPQELKVSG
jgi:hypothetical protein